MLGEALTDPNCFFQTDEIEADLKGAAVRGGAATMAAQACKFTLKVGSTVVLARLLTPIDFGLIAMVAAITNVVGAFKNMGLSMATIQRPKINHAQISTLFWLNVLMSVAIMLVIAAIAPVISWFYGEPRLTWIMLVLAGVFIFGGLTVQHQALLRRQMRFAALAAIEISAMVVGIVIAIASAWHGAGYWALVFMQLAAGITTTVGVWLMCDWRPLPPGRHSGVRSMLTFGGNLTGSSVLNHFTRNLDNVLIGWQWGAQQLGLYAQAYQLLLLPVQQLAPISKVAISTLSRLQADPKRYRTYYLKGVLLCATIGMPIVAFLFVAADKVILTVLGPQWTDSVTIFQVLAPAAFIGTFNVATTWVFISLGRTDRLFRWALIGSSVTALSFIIGIHWGAIGVAAAYSISRPVMRIPGIIYCYRGTPLRLKDLAITLSRPALASISAAVVLISINRFLPIGMNVVVSLFVDCVLYGLLYLGAWMVLPNGRHILFWMLQMTKDLLYHLYHRKEHQYAS